jgi:hypothetical protein
VDYWKVHCTQANIIGSAIADRDHQRAPAAAEQKNEVKAELRGQSLSKLLQEAVTGD